MVRRDTLPVWYAAYGSNCSPVRLLAYLRGSRAPNSAIVEAGATDPSPPAATAACELPHAVRFAGKSRKWGGGVAFLEHAQSEVPSLGRRHLITWSQLDDVVAQESRRPSTPLPIAELNPGDRLNVGDGPYDNLVALDPVDGVPVITFTSPTPPEDREPCAPSETYLRTILGGLAGVHHISADEIARRVLLSPGVAPTWGISSIMALITAVSRD